MKNEGNGISKKSKKEKKSFKTILAGIVALLACPCHLILFLPLLAGTALGSVLSQYTGMITAVMVVVFALSLWYVLRQLFADSK
jgi:mercuric ion transport protein